MGKSWRDYREASRKAIGGNVEDEFRPCDDQIRLGALCRIADALESISHNLAYQTAKKDGEFQAEKKLRLKHERRIKELLEGKK